MKKYVIKRPQNESRINETSRRQKAQRYIEGKSKHVRTISILTSVNPRYPDIPRSGEVDDDGKPLTTYGTDNKVRYERLENHLKVGHYSWFPVIGNYDGFEKSFMIYNISLDDALYLGGTYGQESVIFIDVINEICQYWEQSGDGNFEMLYERMLSRTVNMLNADNLYTRICRTFKFQIPFFDGNDNNEERFDAYNDYVNDVMTDNVNESEIERRLDTIFTAKSGYNKYANRGILNGNAFNWKK